MKGSEEHVKRLLDDLGKALAEAIAASSEVAAAASRIRFAGLTLNLILNCSQRDARSPTARTEMEPMAGASARAARVRRCCPQPPAFRLSASDVAFLAAVGIDGTRRGRSRSGSRN